MRLVALPRERFEGFEMHVPYKSSACYQVHFSAEEGELAAVMRRETCPPSEMDYCIHLFDGRLEAPQAFAMIEDDGRMLALVEVSPETQEQRLRITHLAVDDAHRRRGLGMLMMTKARETARRLHCRSIVVNVSADNHNAMAFFTRQGLMLQGFDALTTPETLIMGCTL